MNAPGDDATLEFTVTGGGQPSAAEATAIARALAAAARSADTQAPGGTAVPAWVRAALLEGTGSKTLTSPHQLR